MKSLVLGAVAVVSALAFSATPALAGGRHHWNNNCNNGWNGWGYRGGYGYCAPVRYYAPPAYYCPPPRPVVYVPGPVFQIGFGWSGGGYCR